MLRIFIAPTDAAATVPDADRRLAGYRLAKLSRITSPRLRAESVGAGALLALALKACFGTDGCELSYAQKANGKPYFADRPDIHFNITHTEGLCAVAVSDVEVGIDAERSVELSERRLNNLIRSGYFSENEIRAFSLGNLPLGSLPLETATANFYRLWTAKESIVKCTGEGIASGFRKVEVPYFTDRCEIGEMKLFSLEYFEHLGHTGHLGYTVTVCSLSDDSPSFEYIEIPKDR